MGVWPRKRARSIVARIRNWPKVESDKPKLLGFGGYKVGMIHVVTIEDKDTSPFYGRQIVKSATVIETPPLLVIGFRAYYRTSQGLKTLGEVWIPDPPKDLERVFTIPEKFNPENQLKKIEDGLDIVSEFRAIVATQPRKAGIHKKKPEVFEIKVDGGDIRAQFEYLKGLLGKEVHVNDIFEEGQFVDVISITKGKGTQGPVKRFGVKELPRWHKHRKGSRKGGSRGPRHPGPMFTSVQAGQMGFHQRTDYNKRILKVSNNPEEINPSGGWKRYGLVKSDFIILEGSVPGPTKRFIKIRYAIRPGKRISIYTGKPNILYMSTKPIMEAGK